MLLSQNTRADMDTVKTFSQLQLMASYLIEQGELKAGNQFKKELVVKCFAGYKGSWGGIKHLKGKTGARPYIQLGLKEGRFTDWEEWKPHLLAISEHQTGTWALACDLAKEDKWLNVEYARIHKSKEIGGFISSDPEHHQLALMTHELAHAADHWNRPRMTWSEKKNVDFATHGGYWRSIYRILRNEFLNPYLPEQA